MIFHHPLLIARAKHDDEDERTFEFVASSGAAVQTRAGPEHLRIGGMSLDRYRKNPVVLDAHSRISSDDVVGKASVRKDGGQLIAKITFARDEKSERIRQKVEDGILNAVSIGFAVTQDEIVDLAEGETDGTGDDEVHGPAVVLNKSELHEISIVPIPADEDALRREFHAQRTAMDKGHLIADDVRAAAEKKKDAKVINLDEERAKAMHGSTALVKARTDYRAAVHAEIRDICPTDLRDHLDALLLDDPDMTFKSAQRALLDERAKTHPTVGTGPPAPITPKTPAKKPASLDDLYASMTAGR